MHKVDYYKLIFNIKNEYKHLSIFSLYLTNREKTTLNKNQQYLEDDLIDIKNRSLENILKINKKNLNVVFHHKSTTIDVLSDGYC